MGMKLGDTTLQERVLYMPKNRKGGIVKMVENAERRA